MDNIYYVYIYYDIEGIPFYVGMGKNNRAYQHLIPSRIKNRESIFFYNKLAKMIKNGDIFNIIILKKNLSLEYAKILEQILIEFIGRRDLNKGALCNLTDGGEGHKGYKKSDELKRRISNWSKGKKLSEEHKERLRQCNLGKKMSDETKLKLSIAHMGVSKPKSKDSIINYRKAARMRADDSEYILKLKKGIHELYNRKVIQCDDKENVIKIWDNQYDVIEYFGYGRPTRIIECCENKRNKHCGYKWKYYEVFDNK